MLADMGRETVYGRPEDRRSRSGHIGNTRRRQLEREVVMKYLRYKFCEMLCSVCVFSNWNNQPPLKTKQKKTTTSSLVSFKWDFHIEISNETGTGRQFLSIKMRFYRHIDIYKVEFMLNKYLKRWVQFVDTVIWVTNTTEYTELIGSEVASKWFSHSWMTARTLPKQAHPGRQSPPRPLRGHGRRI